MSLLLLFSGNLLNNYSLTAGVGSFSLTGQPVSLKWGHRLVAGQATYALSGQVVNLRKGVAVAAARGTFTLAGQVVRLLVGRRLGAGYGSFALTGGRVQGNRLRALAGYYVLTGCSIALLRASLPKRLIVDERTISLTRRFNITS